MGDGDLEHLPWTTSARKRGRRVFHAYMHILTDKVERTVSQHRAGKQAGFEQNLKSITDAHDQSTVLGELFHGIHHRRKAGDGPGPQIISIGEASGDDYCVAPRDTRLFVPNHVDLLPQYVREDMLAIVITVAPR